MNPEFDWQFYCPTCGYREVQRFTESAGNKVIAAMTQGIVSLAHGRGSRDCGTLRLEPCP